MVKAALLAPELEGLSEMTAEELTAALKRYIDGAGVVTASEVEVARELVRRARKAEELERAPGGRLRRAGSAHAQRAVDQGVEVVPERQPVEAFRLGQGRQRFGLAHPRQARLAEAPVPQSVRHPESLQGSVHQQAALGGQLLTEPA